MSVNDDIQQGLHDCALIVSDALTSKRPVSLDVTRAIQSLPMLAKMADIRLQCSALPHKGGDDKPRHWSEIITLDEVMGMPLSDLSSLSTLIENELQRRYIGWKATARQRCGLPAKKRTTP